MWKLDSHENICFKHLFISTSYLKHLILTSVMWKLDTREIICLKNLIISTPFIKNYYAGSGDGNLIGSDWRTISMSNSEGDAHIFLIINFYTLFPQPSFEEGNLVGCLVETWNHFIFDYPVYLSQWTYYRGEKMNKAMI